MSFITGCLAIVAVSALIAVAWVIESFATKAGKAPPVPEHDHHH